MNETTGNSLRYEQIQAIKTRLNKAYTKSGMNINSLLSALNNNSYFELNYVTLKSTLNFGSNTLDIFSVLAMCRYWHLDTAYVFAPPSSAGSPMPESKELIVSEDTGKFIVLDDPQYFGNFYGYLYTPNHTKGEIIRFELEIHNRNGTASADFTYHGFPTLIDGSKREDLRILHGTPILHVTSSNIFIILTNDRGDFYLLYYSRQRFRSHKLYFRRGVILTSSSLRDNPPLVQNFVLFAKPISEEGMKYIPGMLASATHEFTISQKEVDLLKENEPEVTKLFEDFGYILEHNLDPAYRINEKQILHSVTKDTLGNDDIFKALFLLKDRAFLPKRTVYEDDNALASFSKHFLQGVASDDETSR